MAQSKAAAAAAGPADKQAASGKKMLIIVISVLAVLVIGLAGAVGWLFISKSADHGAEGDGPVGSTASLPVFEKMDSFVVNLTGEQGGMLQVEIETELANDAARAIVKAYTPKIRSAIIMLLSSKSAQELASPGGKAKLRNQIRKIINETIGSHGDRPLVIGVVFTSFIVQQ